MSIGTTRPLKPGWRAPSSTTSGRVDRLRPDAVHLGGQACLGRPQVESGQRVERFAQLGRVRADERRQLVEDPLDLGPLGDLGLPPGVAQLNHHERLHEQGLAAARRVVDDALHPAPGVGPDRHHVATVAQGDDRLLEGPARGLGLDQRIEPPAQPVIGDPDGLTQATQAWRSRIQELADRVEAAAEGALEGRQRMELLAKLAQERAALLGQDRSEPAGRLEGLGDLDEVGRIQPATPARPLNPGSDVVGRADPSRGSLAQQATGLVRLIERPSDQDRLVRRFEGIGEPPARAKAGVIGQACPDQPELQEADRLRVHQPDTLGCPLIAKRHGSSIQGCPA